MKGILQVLIGVVIIIVLVWLNFFGSTLGLESLSSYIWNAVKLVFIGGLAWLIFLIGIALIIVGFSELKE